MTDMKRLARSRRKESHSRATVLGTLPIDLAPKERARLFGGLEAFVNTGDSQQQYQSLSKQWPTFWAEDQSPTAWLPGEHSKFLDYRDKLRRLWRGSLDEQEQLSVVAYLLGLISSEEANSLFFTGPEALAELWFQRPNKPLANSAVSTSHSIVLPVWGSIGVRFFARGDFEAALWVLFRESWRARICGQCKRFFIAEKAAGKYCSSECYGAAKRGHRLDWWNKAGKIKRAQKVRLSGKRLTAPHRRKK
jgi:hypothetical protein